MPIPMNGTVPPIGVSSGLRIPLMSKDQQVRHTGVALTRQPYGLRCCAYQVRSPGGKGPTVARTRCVVDTVVAAELMRWGWRGPDGRPRLAAPGECSAARVENGVADLRRNPLPRRRPALVAAVVAVLLLVGTAALI